MLVFRDQHITTEEHIAFGRLFGDLEIHPFTDNDEEHPEVIVLEAGGDSHKTFVAAGWHSDVTWRAEPPMGSILRGRVVPPVGGDTCFADATAAYQRLSDEWKQRVDGLYAIHDYSRVFANRVEPSEAEKIRAKYPPQLHPVIRTHPITAARGIYGSSDLSGEWVRGEMVGGLQNRGYPALRKLAGPSRKRGMKGCWHRLGSLCHEDAAGFEVAWVGEAVGGSS